MDERIFMQQIMDLIKEINLKLLSTLVKLYEPYDLTPPQVAVLSYLKYFNREKVSVLGNRLNTSDSNISAICSRLEKRNMVTRERDQNDQRIVYIQLTSSARDLLEKIHKAKLDKLEQFNHINDDDMVTIISALEKLNELLDSTSKL